MENPTVQEPGRAATPSWLTQTRTALGLGGWTDQSKPAEITVETRNGHRTAWKKFTKLDGTEGIMEATPAEMRQHLPGYTPERDAARTAEEKKDKYDAEQKEEARKLAERKLAIETARLQQENERINGTNRTNEGQVQVGHGTNQTTAQGNLLQYLSSAGNTEVEKLKALGLIADTFEDNKREDTAQGHRIKMDEYNIYNNAMNRYLELEREDTNFKRNTLSRVGNRLAMAFGGQPL